MLNNKNIRYIAAIPLLIIAVWSLIDLVSFFHIYNFIVLVGIVLVAVGVFTYKPVLSSIGFGLNALIAALRMYNSFSWYIPFCYDYGLFYYLSTIITYASYILFYLLLVIAGIKLKNAKKISIIAAIVATARLALLFIKEISIGYSIGISGLFSGVLNIAVAVLFAFVCDYIYNNPDEIKKAVSKVAVKNNTSAQATSTETTVEKLTKLKNLLDMGAITQEEFDSKKKQLLGL